MQRILVTGASGYLGAAVIAPLRAGGHFVRAMARTPGRVTVEADEVVRGDALSGEGLDAALQDIDVAYYLIHSMEGTAGDLGDVERRCAENFAAAAQRAGVRRTVYLGGLVPADEQTSRHLGSRLAVERILLAGTPECVAFRASIVIGARSRSFRFLVRLVERTPVIPLPAWQRYRTQPIDERDVLAFLVNGGTSPEVSGALSLDIAGPDVMTYGELMLGVRDHLMVGRPAIRLPVNFTPVASKIAAAIASEDVGLIEPLMESLDSDLLPRDDRAQQLFGVRLHSFDASVERALRDWEATEQLAAR